MMDLRSLRKWLPKKKVWLLINGLIFVGVLLLQKEITTSLTAPSDREDALFSYLNFLLPLRPSHPAVALKSGAIADGPATEVVKTYTFRRGDSFLDALLGFGVSRPEIDAIFLAAKGVYNLGRVVPGRQIRFLIDKSSGLVQWLDYEMGGVKRLKIQRDGEGFQATAEVIPVQTQIRFAEGIIVDNLYNAAKAARVPNEIILDLADLFAWDIDFSEETYPGDRFRVVYETRLRDGAPFETGRILAAEYTHQGTRLQTFYYAPTGGASGYFDQRGKSIKKAFVKSPLRYRYISSGFSESRYHPLLHISRPHLGVDYAAPRGTPVMAAADGVVRLAGWNGGFGNCIIVEHGGGYSTLYGHLQGFSAGLRVGQKVEQKEIIGYVGSTGISTGPHLHYTFMRRGVPINPVQAGQITTKILLGPELEAFRRQIEPYQRWMEAPTPDAV